MNRAFSAFTLSGKTIDVGGGHHPDYFDYFQQEPGTQIEALDASLSGIDFETDALPYADASIDTIICANVLEHIFNYQHLTNEMQRILKPSGQLIGFVPFLQQYHPDPNDYFRYTRTALERILHHAGFNTVQVREVGGGPFLVNYNILMLSLPRILRVLLYPLHSALDVVFLSLRPGAAKRLPLGFTFSATIS
ncbi:MAG: hypothetical protein JWM39_820 [Parcubacteria group bacterium]|nr:hypothetical protein [Parcubacteria group bacterium]